MSKGKEGRATSLDRRTRQGKICDGDDDEGDGADEDEEFDLVGTSREKTEASEQGRDERARASGRRARSGKGDARPDVLPAADAE